MSERPKVLEVLKTIGEVLQLVMALKDAYNDISRRHNTGRPVRRRAKQLHSNLKAVLEADRCAAEDPDGFECEQQDSQSQPELPFGKSIPEDKTG